MDSFLCILTGPHAHYSEIYSKRKSIIGTVMEWIRAVLPQNTILVSAIRGTRPIGALSPHVPNVRVHSHVSLFSRKFWASKVIYRGSAVDLSVVFCTPTACCSSSRNSSKFSALERDIAPETTVLRRIPPKTLLEHPPKRTAFYMPLSRRKLSKCV